ncbi:CDP-alcohol phosphatidyltransferase family protein [Microbacterium mangrovi]|uniref:CDP-alcohol phosphatidyltransferase family protein n=1 Tax=Microbacterium mangrovi TaxID=1348253 RepID=UPI00068B38BE|nr:CDP-alcohol phosphatidyltransferase family protein [Microbacterium mangrovi]
MSKVHSLPWWWATGGVLVLFAAAAFVPLGIAGWAAGLGYLVVSSQLLSRGLSRTGAMRLGPANAVTATRSVLVGVITALVAASLVPGAAPAAALLVPVAATALVLDGVDGIVARRTGSVTELGGRFDMEVDAFLLLVLSVYDVRFVGWWVLAIGLMRYAFVAAAWVLPWMAATLPPRYWRKVVAASCGILLTVVAAGLLPAGGNALLAGIALLLLVESFGRDVIWLVRTRTPISVEVNRSGAGSVSPAQGSE